MTEALERKLNERSEDLAQRCMVACSDLELKLQSETGACTDRIEDQYRHFTDVCAKLTSELQTQSSDLSSRIESLRDAQDSQIGQLGATLDSHMEKTSVNHSALQKRLTTTAELHNDLIQTHHRKNLAAAEKSERHFDDLESSTRKRFEDHYQHFTTVAANLLKKFSDSHADLDDKFTNSVSQLDKQLRERYAAHDKRVHSEHQHFTDVCANLDKKFTDETIQLDEKFSDKAAATDARIDDVANAVDRHHDHFSDTCAKLNKKFSSKSAIQDDVIESNQSSMQTMTQRLDAKFSQECEKLGQQFTAKQRDYEVRLSELSGESSRRSQQATDAIANLDSKFNDISAAQDDLINDHHGYFTSVFNKLDKTVSEVGGEMHSRIEL